MSGHWSLALNSALTETSLHVFSDDKIVAINDKYPKSTHHYLIMPRRTIKSLKEIESCHLVLLEHMHDVGMKLARRHPQSTFRFGYHAQPSMQHLHLHVISDDFISPSMKNKKHWNSFTSGFFLNSLDVINSLRDDGKVISIPEKTCQELLSRPLKCHKCDFLSPTIPKLKQHLLQHV